MKKMTLVQGLVAAAVAAVLVACGGGGGAPYQDNGSGGTGGGNGGGGGGIPDPNGGVSIDIGSDGMIQDSPDGKYRKVFTVTVTTPKVGNTGGNPVKGATVYISARPTKYYKGLWIDRTATPPTRNNAAVCAAEDTIVERNDILDPGEDLNGDGRLTPANAIVSAQMAAAPGGSVNPDLKSAVTNERGVALVWVEWAKSNATWFEYELTGKATGTGYATELQGTYTFTASANGDEFGDAAFNAFTVSPFGQQPGCDNTN